MKEFVLDANVALRFLLADDPVQSPKARSLFELAETGRVRLRLSHVAVAELVWVLGSFFEFPRAEIGVKLRGLMLHDGIELENRNLVLDALDRFSRINVDFPDCYAAEWSAETGHPVTTYDRDFRRFTDVAAQTPEAIVDSEKQ